MTQYPCPACGKARTSDDASCESCGWTRAAPHVAHGPACPFCGGKTFVSGLAHGHYPLKFVAEDANWLAKATIFGGEEIRARKCDICGNVQLFV
jgi:predicted RNA-binding Zn-ribbon protein involved in translation (DUF1610 family)